MAIATASHVIQHAWEWDEPIRIHHPATGETRILTKDERYIFIEPERDAAAIVSWENLEFLPEQPLALLKEDLHLKVGVDIGWLGFPGSIPGGSELCYFGGRISAYLPDREAYLVDGVAIHGVSGGPAFYIKGDEVVLIGIVSAYVPNRQTGETLPGLMMLKTIAHLHEVIKTINSVEEADRTESEQVDAIANT